MFREIFRATKMYIYCNFSNISMIKFSTKSNREIECKFKLENLEKCLCANSLSAIVSKSPLDISVGCRN